MFDNFTCEDEYHSYDVILEANDREGALLLGDFNSATDENVLRQHSVQTVMTTALGLDHLEIPSFVDHIVLPLKDAKTENIRIFFEETYETICKKLQIGGVLVHCAAGVSRSATIIIAYLMKKNKMSFKEAINFVRSKRKVICPNLGFELQLKKYAEELMTKKDKNEKKFNQTQSLHQQPKLIKKNVSEKFDDKKKIDVQLQNQSLFLFEAKKTSFQIQGLRKKNPSIKKGITKHVNYSKPKEKQFHDILETELFISGKSAKRPSSQVHQQENEKNYSTRTHMLGTWGPKQNRFKF